MQPWLKRAPLNSKHTYYFVTGYMNCALEQTEEYVDGQVARMDSFFLKVYPYLSLQLKQKYGDAFIRGNNILSVYFAFALFCIQWCLRQVH